MILSLWIIKMNIQWFTKEISCHLGVGMLPGRVGGCKDYSSAKFALWFYSFHPYLKMLLYRDILAGN
jgi:hypothetical protein